MTRRYGVYGRKYSRAGASAGDMPGSKHAARFGTPPAPEAQQDPNPPERQKDPFDAEKLHAARHALSQLGYHIKGVFTKHSDIGRVIRFQRDYNAMLKCGVLSEKHKHLKVDGIIGPKTYHAIKVARNYDLSMPKDWMHYVKKCYFMLEK